MQTRLNASQTVTPSVTPSVAAAAAAAGTNNSLLKSLYHERMARLSVRRTVMDVSTGQITHTAVKDKSSEAGSPTAAATAADIKTPTGTGSDRDRVVMIERVGEAIGSIVWTGAISLCQFMRTANDSGVLPFSGQRVLELGAGIGCCGIYANRLGAALSVVTDRQPLIALLHQNITANSPGGGSGEDSKHQSVLVASELSWGQFPLSDRISQSVPFDIVLASDVVYK